MYPCRWLRIGEGTVQRWAMIPNDACHDGDTPLIVFLEVAPFWSSRTLPKADLENACNCCRIRHPTAYVYRENHAKRNGLFPPIWVKERRHSAELARIKSATSTYSACNG